MATQSPSPRPFTHWGLPAEGFTLELWVQDGRKITGQVNLDVRDLPMRPDLLSRLEPKTRARLVREAQDYSDTYGEAAKQ